MMAPKSVWATIGALALGILVALPFLGGSFATYMVFSVLIFATIATGWNLMAGFCGLLSIGNQLYIGLAAYVVAMLTYYLGLSVWAAWIVGGCGAGLLAFIVAWTPASENKRVSRVVFALIAVAWICYEVWVALYPSRDPFQSLFVGRLTFALLAFLWLAPMLQLQGAYFAIATWLVAETMQALFGQWNMAGAGNGIRIPSAATTTELYYAAMGVLIATLVAASLLLRSKWGLALTAVRDDSEAAEAVGIDVKSVKLLTYVLAAVMIGLAGGLYFINAAVVTPSSAFTVLWTAYMIFMVVAGGMGTLSGGVVGALLFVAIQYISNSVTDLGLIALGAVSILIVVLVPRGIVGSFYGRIASKRLSAK